MVYRLYYTRFVLKRKHKSLHHSIHKKKTAAFSCCCFLMESGGDLPSRAVSSQVLSALKGLTSVFGMGTGGTPSSLPPEMVAILFRKPLSLCPDNCTSNDSLIWPFNWSHFWGSFNLRTCVKSSPRPISIIKLHVLPHFHRWPITW